MKKIIISFLVLCLPLHVCRSQEWMTSLDVAKRLALVQDKMILMMWEESTLDPLPIVVNATNGQTLAINNLFESVEANQLIWDHFVPVKVSESKYLELYNKIKEKRSLAYIDKFNDDSIKIMDANGNILNTDINLYERLNLSLFINKYYVNTSYLKGELSNYSREQNFVTTFRLAAKYIDVAALVNEDVRSEMIDLSTLYLNEAEQRLEEEAPENKAMLEQKCEFLKLEQELILNHPKRVLRKLKRIENSEMDTANTSEVAYLYFTAYIILKDEKNASLWRNKLSLVNLKKANQIIEINR